MGIRTLQSCHTTLWNFKEGIKTTIKHSMVNRIQVLNIIYKLELLIPWSDVGFMQDVPGDVEEEVLFFKIYVGPSLLPGGYQP
jgi:hypothetical protein